MKTQTRARDDDYCCVDRIYPNHPAIGFKAFPRFRARRPIGWPIRQLHTTHASWRLETELEEAVAHAAAQIRVCNIGRKNCRLPCFNNPGHRANNVTLLLIEICACA